MNPSYHVRIEGPTNPKEFVEKWSKYYSYSNEEKYNNHILSVLDNQDSFLQLFQWKNGTGNVISKPKMKVVEGFLIKYDILKELRSHFSWKIYEDEFQPMKSSSIWKIFLLHLINPFEFPIYDQHVFRFYYFFLEGKITEISNNHSIVYKSYKEYYQPWFNEYRKKYNLYPKKMDESFFVFGQMLKGIKNYPIEVSKE